MTKLHFNFIDIFRAGRLGLSAKKMGLSFLGVLIAYVGYLILSYVSLIVSGLGFGVIWDTYRLFPVAVVGEFPWYSWVIYGLGLLFAVVVLLLTSAGISKITYQQLKGDEFYSIGDSRKFVWENWKAILFSPAGLLGMIAFFIVAGILIGLLGRIPYVGEIGFSVFSLIIFGGAFVAVCLAIPFLVSLTLSPAIVATTNEDTIETITQVFSTIWSQPWRFIFYEVLLGGTIAVGVYVLGFLTTQGVFLINWICGLTMGDKLSELSKVALGYIPINSGWFNFIIDKLSHPRGFVPEITVLANAGGTVFVSGVIAGVMLLFVVYFVFSYGFATWSSGQTLTYVVLRKKKDDENLLEKKEEAEEKAEEEIKESGKAKEQKE